MLIKLGLNPSPLGLGLGYKVGDLFLKAVLSSWEICSIEVLCGICQHICADSAFFQDTCPPIALFKFMMYHNQLSWGHYAIYITWLHRHFPSEGVTVFRYLRKHYSKNMYSFSYLAGQYLTYHGNKIICFLCRSYRTWITEEELPKFAKAHKIPVSQAKKELQQVLSYTPA